MSTLQPKQINVQLRVRRLQVRDATRIDILLTVQRIERVHGDVLTLLKRADIFDLNRVRVSGKLVAVLIVVVRHMFGMI